jgi:5' nucleotidase, deoxy (Pyrimidine), cytosolic type C protein (NT5C)
VKPVFAIDIDGTLGDHYGHFTRFAEMWTGHEIKFNPQQGWPDGATKFQFNRALGLGKSTYRQIKLAYRQGGMKRSMPCYDGASMMMRGLRRAGAEVWITTSRPYLRHDSIDPDTRHWLRRNRIQFDNLIYGDRKYYDLVRLVGKGRAVACLDDLPEMCLQSLRAGIHIPILMERPHNKQATWGGLSAASLTEADYLLRGLLNAK